MKRMILPISWMIIIFLLSSLHGNAFPSELAKKYSWLVHLFEYFVLGFLFCRALGQKTFLVFSICILFAISDEVHQLFVPFRMFSIYDILTDTVGVLLGTTVRRKRWR